METRVFSFLKNGSRPLLMKSKAGLIDTLQMLGIISLFKESHQTHSMYRKVVLYNPIVFSNNTIHSNFKTFPVQRNEQIKSAYTLTPFTKLSIFRFDLLTEIDSRLPGSLNIVASGP